jgi:TPP-dependent 2-oxoacid decarboxylase
MIKVSDYIANKLSENGIKHVFMISGGGAMHLVDSVGKHPKLNYYCPHHEQAAAIAAEGYSRTSGKMGVVVVTSDPGGTNTLTGVLGQWLDSVPCLYLSGQVKFETTIESVPQLKLRQLGDQEINIVDIVKPVTKYAEAWNFGPDEMDSKTVEWLVKRLCSKWGGNASYSIDKREHPHETKILKLDSSKAKARLKWKTKTHLDRAIDKVIEWTKEYKEKKDLRRVCIDQIEEYTHTK